MTYDVFVSYRHSRKAEVVEFVKQLEAAGIVCFRDDDRRDDDASIQRGIENGLARSKLLLAWFDPTYLHSRPCAWELSRAILAARHQGEDFGRVVARIVCIDPTGTFTHIEPEELWDSARSLNPAQPENCIRQLREQLDRVHAPFGDIVSGDNALWYERECPSHPTWVGRDAELNRLLIQLCRGETAIKAEERARVAITGAGGEGKTMLAEQYAIRYGAAYPAGIVWLNGSRVVVDSAVSGPWLHGLEHQLDEIAQGKLGISTKDLLDGITEPRRRVRALKRAIEERLDSRSAALPSRARGGYLWVVDDLPALHSNDDLLLWAPAGNHVHCIATMRESAAEHGFRQLQIKALDKTSAFQILTRRLAPDGAAEQQAALAIVERLGRLPLALELAAAAVRSYAGFLALLERPLNQGLEPLLAKLKGALPTDHARSIVQTFDRSLALLPGAEQTGTGSDDEATWTLIRAAAFVAPAPLPDRFAWHLHREMGFDEALFESALLSSDQASVVRRHGRSARPGSQMHILLARTVLETRMSQAQRSRLLAAAVVALRQWAEEEGTRPVVDIDRRIFAVAEAFLKCVATPAAADAAGLLGDLASEAGRPANAAELFTFCLDVRMAQGSGRDPASVDAREKAALGLLALGRTAEATAMLEDVVSLRLQSGLPSDDPSTLNALTHLATAYNASGEFDKARERQEWIVQRQRQAATAPAVLLGAMNNLALTLGHLGEHERARRMHVQVLQARQSLLHPEHPDVLDSLLNVATGLQETGEFLAAQKLQRQALAAYRRTRGPESPEAMSGLHNLAITQRLRSKPASACRVLQRVVEVQRRIAGTSHPATMSSTHEWALALRESGCVDQAATLFEAVLDVRLRDLGPGHPNTQNTRQALADCHAHLAR